MDAVEAGDSDAKQALGQRILDGIDQHNWSAWTWIESAPFLPLADLDPANVEDNDVEWFCDNEQISEDRVYIVRSGDRLTGSDLTCWRAFMVERAFSPGEFDHWLLWFLIEVRRTDGRRAYVASFGPVADVADWCDLPAASFVAAYDTYTETLTALKSVGFLSLDDYQARSSEVLAHT